MKAADDLDYLARAFLQASAMAKAGTMTEEFLMHLADDTAHVLDEAADSLDKGKNDEKAT